jgi:hypothetical protein
MNVTVNSILSRCRTEKLPSVENVHERNWKNVRLFSTGKIRDMGVERDALVCG